MKRENLKYVDLSVVIPTYNRGKQLINTVESITSGNSCPRQIIIIDQTPNILRIKIPKYIEDKTQIIYLRQEVPSSAKARNTGIKYSDYNNILFCDDDILVNKDTISFLWQNLSKSNIALVAAVHYENNAYFKSQKVCIFKDFFSTLLGWKKFWKNNGYVIKTSMRGRYSHRIKNIVNTEWAMGYFFALKKDLCEEWNIQFDEKLMKYSYAEDLDMTYRFCKKANQKGMKTIVDPSIYVNHLVSEIGRLPNQEIVMMQTVNRRYLSYKNFPNKPIYRFIMNIYDIENELITINKEQRKYLINARKTCNKNKNYIKNGELSKISF